MVTSQRVTLPKGPSTLDICIPATLEGRKLTMAVVATSDLGAITPEVLSGQVCAGCP